MFSSTPETQSSRNEAREALRLSNYAVELIRLFGPLSVRPETDEQLRRATESGLLPMPNLPALRKSYEWVMEQSELPPEKRSWKQTLWRQVKTKVHWANQYGRSETECGTAMCFAGHALDVAGVVWRDKDDAFTVPENLKDVLPTGEYASSVSYTARRYLGLTEHEAGALFEGNNKVQHIRGILTHVFARAGEVL